MYRGTTEELTFEIETGFDLSNIVEAWVTLQVALYKRTFTIGEGSVSINPEENKVILALTQEDTLEIPKGNAKLQIRFLDEDGNASATEIVNHDVYSVLQKGVITDE